MPEWIGHDQDFAEVIVGVCGSGRPAANRGLGYRRYVIVRIVVIGCRVPELVSRGPNVPIRIVLIGDISAKRAGGAKSENRAQNCPGSRCTDRAGDRRGVVISRGGATSNCEETQNRV